ncbi:MAG: 3-oxoacyl-[acyl-carrier-protein] reductase FabG [Anaerolineae bacterium]|nr:3-oxoacyl-[acyl-carrier-protein] reductase FabG [Anaerolineae bacterium]
MDPKGKTAFVTASARRIGRATTLALAQAGANVVINYRTSAQEAEATAAEARALGVKALTVQFDMADYRGAAAVIERIAAKLGPVDILVNNASLFKQAPVPTQDFTIWHNTIDVIVHTPFYCANAVAPYMLEKGEGVIINIVDLSAWEAWPGYAAHSVAKAALLAQTRQLALELAPTVRVNAVAPGPVLRPLHYTEEMVASVADKTLLNRWGTPENVAETVLFLVKNDYITGEYITVDGGERYGHRKYEAG